MARGHRRHQGGGIWLIRVGAEPFIDGSQDVGDRAAVVAGDTPGLSFLMEVKVVVRGPGIARERSGGFGAERWLPGRHRLEHRNPRRLVGPPRRTEGPPFDSAGQGRRDREREDGPSEAGPADDLAETHDPDLLPQTAA